VVDVSIPAGESPVIHGAGAPTAVRVRFDRVCPGKATVERDDARGAAGARAAPPVGRSDR
jgi:hypothetical protein